MKKIIIIGLLLCIYVPVKAADIQQPIHAIFDEDYNWLTKEGADRLLDKAQELGFNVIIPCVWHGRGTTWDSSFSPFDDRFGLEIYAERDPIQYLIDEAHARDIQVHPWFTVYLRRRAFFIGYADTTVADMFNIHSDPFRVLITNIIREFVQKYNVDGINLDYIRSKEICEMSVCKDDYFNKTQRNLELDILIRYTNQTARDSLIAWQTESVTKTVKSISEAVKAVKPEIILSVDTLVDNPQWKLLGANGLQWLNSGLIDVAFHMDYRDPIKSSNVINAKEQLEHPGKMVVLMGNRMESGNAVVPRDAEDVVRLIDDAKNLSPDTRAFGFYKYKYLTEEQEQAIKDAQDQQQ